MIPKIIHYCWFGKKEMPINMKNNILLWKEKLGDYDFILWNEKNFDIGMKEVVKDAYEKGNYAFVSDYVRVYALNQFGGVYLDTDIEIIKNFDSLLNYSFFIGCESEEIIQTGVIGAKKNSDILINIKKIYDETNFNNINDYKKVFPNTVLFTNVFLDLGWKGNLMHDKQIMHDDTLILSKEYLCAKCYNSGKILQTENTYCIHHFNASWVPKKKMIVDKIVWKIKNKKLI